MGEKTRWRAEAKDRRARNLTDRIERDRRLVDHLEQWMLDTLDRDTTVVLYDALPGEADLSALKVSHRLLSNGVSFALTRTPEVGFDLTVHPVDSPMEDHRFGYRQPVVSAPVIDSEDIAAVLVPALAFDRHGNRLGFGAGYYDRFLARLPEVYKVGIADVLVEELLPAESFDIPMTHLATVDAVDAVTDERLG